MKKNKIIKFTLTLVIGVLLTFNSFSQVIGYAESALLFSQENIKGTARFTAMSGAFGALGGNISAVDINPAGLTVFNESEATLTLDNNSIDTNSKFYNTTTNSSDDNFNLSQAGALLVFDNGSEYWSKFAVGINYTIVNDYENSYLTKGVSPLTEFNQDPFDEAVFYENVDSQRFLNSTAGSTDRVTFSIAGQFDNKTSFGFSLNTYDLDYGQIILFNERSNDGEGNTLNANLVQDLFVFGEGISLSLGVITKPIDNLRLGLAYQSPTWYNVTEEFRESITINLSNNDDVLNENPNGSVFDYEIRTPSKVTGSIAYVFGKKGLISLDYTFKDYSNIKLKPSSEFNDENQSITNDLQNTTSIRVGGEYRYKNISLRAGFHSDQNPIKNFKTDKEGYSLGLGIKINDATKLDFSYDNTTSKQNYSFLNFVNPAQIENTNDRITTTLTIGL